jgi:hypothetical protein
MKGGIVIDWSRELYLFSSDDDKTQVLLVSAVSMIDGFLFKKIVV